MKTKSKEVKKVVKKRSVKSPLKKEDIVFVAKGEKLKPADWKRVKAMIEKMSLHNNGVLLLSYMNGDQPTDCEGIMFAFNTNNFVIRNLINNSIEYFQILPPDVMKAVKNGK